MTWVDFFKQKIKEISQGIFPKEPGKIKILATSSVDSIIACSFLAKTFFYLSHNFSCSFSRKISDSIINELATDSSNLVILINPQISLEKLLKINNKKIVIIESFSKDLTQLQSNSPQNITVISPQQFSQNLEVPASSLTYLLCKELYPQISEFSYLLPMPFFETDLEIPEPLLSEAILGKKLEVKRGITMLISQTLPIHKAVANTLCPYLPKISGSEDNAIQFLLENEISVRENSKYKKIEDLNEEQTKKLLTAIILKRLGSEKNPELTIGNAYILISEEDTSIIKDLKGFNYLLNSCIAYSKPSLALNICLNPKLKSKAYEFFNNSQIGLVTAMESYLLSKKSKTTESIEISILNVNNILDYKFLDMFTKIVNNCNFLTSKFIAVLTSNPGGEILVQVESSNPKNNSELPKLALELQKLMPIQVELNPNSIIFRGSQDNEQTLINNLTLAAESLKSQIQSPPSPPQ